jgi:hypothetical protein
MATVNMAYDHPQYTAHQVAEFAEQGGSGTTFAKFVAPSAIQAFAYQVTVTTAGTQTASGGAQLNFVKVSGTTTTTTTFKNIGTALQAFQTTNITLSGSAGGLSLAQGDLLQVTQGTDATLRAVYALEYAFQPLASVTQ